MPNKYPFLDLLETHGLQKQAGVISNISNWTGENILGPMARGIGKATNFGDKVETMRQKTVDETAPVIADRVAESATNRAADWLKDTTSSAKQKWEDLYGRGMGALYEKTPEKLTPVVEWMAQHPYLTPTMAMLIPTLATIAYRKTRGNDDREENSRSQAQPAARATSILNKFL